MSAGMSFKNGRLTLGTATPGNPATGTPVKITDIRINERGQKLEDTNSESGGFETFVDDGGVSGGDMSFTVVYKISDGIMALVQRNNTYPVVCYPDRIGFPSSNWNGNVFVEQCEWAGEVKGMVHYRVSGVTNGAYARSGM